MAKELAKNIPEIDSIILVEHASNDFSAKLSSWPKPILGIYSPDSIELKRLLEVMSKDPSRKLLFIETSWGNAKYFSRDRTFWIPMWEQSWEDSKYSEYLLSCTKFTHNMALDINGSSRYLPFPVDLPQNIDFKKEVKRIIHNAGSFGADFRKGTIEAIKIFQESKISEKGGVLEISHWNNLPPQIVTQVEKDDSGIEFTSSFKNNWEEIYKNADLLLFPSKLEGHALVVLEAYSRGIPALLTDTAPINEYESDKDFLIKVNKIESNRAILNLEDGIRKLQKIFDEGIYTKSKSCYELIEENFSWETLLPIYRELFA